MQTSLNTENRRKRGGQSDGTREVLNLFLALKMEEGARRPGMLVAVETRKKQGNGFETLQREFNPAPTWI